MARATFVIVKHLHVYESLKGSRVWFCISKTVNRLEGFTTVWPTWPETYCLELRVNPHQKTQGEADPDPSLQSPRPARLSSGVKAHEDSFWDSHFSHSIDPDKVCMSTPLPSQPVLALLWRFSEIANDAPRLIWAVATARNELVNIYIYMIFLIRSTEDLTSFRRKNTLDILKYDFVLLWKKKHVLLKLEWKGFF